MNSILIVGAGISGLLAAQELQAHGFNVTVIDKGRGLGGRMATRRLIVGERTGRADHGAQYITAYHPRFEAFVRDLCANGILEPWLLTPHQQHTAKRLRYIAPEGMTAVAKYSARGLQIRLGERVVRLATTEHGWRITTDKNDELQADGLLITSPIPQTLMLLDTLDKPILLPDERMALESVKYIPSIALMLALGDGYSSSLAEKKMHFEGGKALMWIADNKAKGISPDVPTLTIHTNPDFAAEYWETREEDLLAIMLQELGGIVPKDLIQDYSIHRWRYSRVAKPFPALFFAPKSTSSNLILAGDAFAPDTPMMTRVEDAAISGWSAAEYIRELY